MSVLRRARAVPHALLQMAGYASQASEAIRWHGPGRTPFRSSSAPASDRIDHVACPRRPGLARRMSGPAPLKASTPAVGRCHPAMVPAHSGHASARRSQPVSSDTDCIDREPVRGLFLQRRTRLHRERSRDQVRRLSLHRHAAILVERQWARRISRRQHHAPSAVTFSARNRPSPSRPDPRPSPACLLPVQANAFFPVGILGEACALPLPPSDT